EAQARDEQKDAREPSWRVGVDYKLERIGKALLRFELRGERIEDQRDNEDLHKSQQVADDGADQPRQDRDITEADKRGTDEARNRWDERQDAHIAGEQNGRLTPLVRDLLPFGLRRQQNGLHALE